MGFGLVLVSEDFGEFLVEVLWGFVVVAGECDVLLCFDGAVVVVVVVVGVCWDGYLDAVSDWLAGDFW